MVRPTDEYEGKYDYEVFTRKQITVAEKQISMREFERYLDNQVLWEMSQTGWLQQPSQKRWKSEGFGKRVAIWGQWYSSQRLLPFLMNWQTYRNDAYSDHCKSTMPGDQDIPSESIAPSIVQGNVSEMESQSDIPKGLLDLINDTFTSKTASPAKAKALNIARFANVFDQYRDKVTKKPGNRTKSLLLPDAKDYYAYACLNNYATAQSLCRTYFSFLSVERNIAKKSKGRQPFLGEGMSGLFPALGEAVDYLSLIHI